jgi:hypothetical protein
VRLAAAVLHSRKDPAMRCETTAEARPGRARISMLMLARLLQLAQVIVLWNHRALIRKEHVIRILKVHKAGE